MREERVKRVRRQHHDLAQILNESKERPSERVEKSGEHLLLCLHTQRLGFCFWPKFRWNRAHKSRVERELAKDSPDFAKGNGGLVELEINQVVIAIDLVTQAGNGRELMIQLQDLIQLAQTCRVNFQFQHLASNFTDAAVRCKKKRVICVGRRAE